MPPRRRRSDVGLFSPNGARVNSARQSQLVLYDQFRFFFNLFFLAVALSQFVPVLKVGAFRGSVCARARSRPA